MFANKRSGSAKDLVRGVERPLHGFVRRYFSFSKSVCISNMASSLTLMNRKPCPGGNHSICRSPRLFQIANAPSFKNFRFSGNGRLMYTCANGNMLMDVDT